MPGNIPIHGKEENSVSTSPESIPPQDIVSAGSPTPKKLKEASMMIAEPIIVVAITIVGPKVFGRTCLRIIRMSVAPMALDAST